MKDNGNYTMELKKEKEQVFYIIQQKRQMEMELKFIKVIGKMINLMVLEFINTHLEHYIKECLKMDYNTDKVNTNSLTVVFT